MRLWYFQVDDLLEYWAAESNLYFGIVPSFEAREINWYLRLEPLEHLLHVGWDGLVHLNTQRLMPALWTQFQAEYSSCGSLASEEKLWSMYSTYIRTLIKKLHKLVVSVCKWDRWWTKFASLLFRLACLVGHRQLGLKARIYRHGKSCRIVGYTLYALTKGNAYIIWIYWQLHAWHICGLASLIYCVLIFSSHFLQSRAIGTSYYFKYFMPTLDTSVWVSLIIISDIFHYATISNMHKKTNDLRGPHIQNIQRHLKHKPCYLFHLGNCCVYVILDPWTHFVIETLLKRLIGKERSDSRKGSFTIPWVGFFVVT